ncbi:DUF2478 domain-containing protein [Paenirhodobacter sp.]|uniref:DUF2478 domain-containing protein n=1 Tax=Paenirhodobacter sp. TaxID=1965326 RepID=UPI003B3E213C
MRLAAVVFDDDSVDTVMADALAALPGKRVLGYLQTRRDQNDCDCSQIALTALHDGSRRVITQNLGRESQGCSLDPAALAEVAGLLETQLSGRPDLLVLNRFGKIEAEGGGMRAVLEQALEAGIPILLAVNRKHLPAWRDYCGGLAEELPCDVDTIRNFALTA